MKTYVYLLQYYEHDSDGEWTQGVYKSKELAAEYASANQHLLKGFSGYYIREYVVVEDGNE